jgi:hypothetical protein
VENVHKLSGSEDFVATTSAAAVSSEKSFVSEEFPLFSQVKGYQCRLLPGQLLYIPYGWWHHIESAAISSTTVDNSPNNSPSLESDVTSNDVVVDDDDDDVDRIEDGVESISISMRWDPYEKPLRSLILARKTLQSKLMPNTSGGGNICKSENDKLLQFQSSQQQQQQQQYVKQLSIISMMTEPLLQELPLYVANIWRQRFDQQDREQFSIYQ